MKKILALGAGVVTLFVLVDLTVAGLVIWGGFKLIGHL